MADTPVDNPYERLGVERNATIETIKAAHRAKSKSLHPDHLPKEKMSKEELDAAVEEFRRVQDAYSILNDTEARARYDKTGEAETDAEKSLHEKALDRLTEVFFTIVDSEEFPETQDLIKLVRDELKAQQVTAATSTHLTRQKMRKYQRVRNRIHTQREEDPFTRGCEEIIEGMKQHLEDFAAERELLEIALAISGEFVFDFVIENAERYHDDVRKAALLDAKLLALPGAGTE